MNDNKAPFEYEQVNQASQELTENDYFEPVGFKYNLAQDSEAPLKLRVNNLKFQLNRGDELIKEMSSVLNTPVAHSSPIEGALTSLVSHKYEPEMPPSLLPTFKEKINKNIELAKKSNNLHAKTHRINPDVLAEQYIGQSGEENKVSLFSDIIGDMSGQAIGKLGFLD